MITPGRKLNLIRFPTTEFPFTTVLGRSAATTIPAALCRTTFPCTELRSTPPLPSSYAASTIPQSEPLLSTRLPTTTLLTLGARIPGLGAPALNGPLSLSPMPPLPTVSVTRFQPTMLLLVPTSSIALSSAIVWFGSVTVPLKTLCTILTRVPFSTKIPWSFEAVMVACDTTTSCTPGPMKMPRLHPEASMVP